MSTESRYGVGIAFASWVALVMAPGCTWEVTPADNNLAMLDTGRDAEASAEADAASHEGNANYDGSAQEPPASPDGSSCDVTPDAAAPPPAEDPGACTIGEKIDDLGPFKCGETFATKVIGECNDCNDPGCTTTEPGVYECTCYGKEEYCRLNDGDASLPMLCWERATQCDCGDGNGRVYQCSCEGGVSTPDECGCRVPPEGEPFDYELECES